jgi:signal transduction histidine kinase
MKEDLLIKHLLPHWPGAPFSQRGDWTLECCTANFQDLTGITREAAQQPGWFWELIHEEERESLRQRLSGCAGASEGQVSQFRIRHAVTGRILHLLEFRKPRLSPAGQLEAYEGYWQDVTRQARQDQRLGALLWKETLGGVALGFAHDFNNLLTGVLSLSDAYLEQTGLADSVREGLVLIRQNAQQAARLVRHLADLYHSQPGPPSYQDLNAATADTVGLLRRVISRRIGLASELAAGPLPVYVDPVHLRQATIALALDAAGAITDRGQIMFQTSRHQQWPQSPSGKPGVCLAIRYPASGQPGALGLAQARRFADKHRGAMTVDSPAGESATTLRLWLPESDFTEAELNPQAGKKNRSVLLLGPESGDLMRLAQVLRGGACQVVIAGQEGMELLLSDDYHFDALLVQASPAQATDPALLALARKLKLKVAVQPLGGSPQALEPTILSKADLILPEGAADAHFLSRFGSLWD